MASKPGGRSVDRVAADANVILSALVHKAARRIFTSTSIEVCTTAANVREVETYLPQLADLYELVADVVAADLRLLPVRVVSRRDYARFLGEAERRIGQRDPDDVELLALALSMEIPVWSNDNDFADAGVEWYTTARLLRATGA